MVDVRGDIRHVMLVSQYLTIKLVLVLSGHKVHRICGHKILHHLNYVILLLHCRTIAAFIYGYSSAKGLILTTYC